MKVDTRDIKPKIYNILITSIITAIIIGTLFLRGDPNPALISIIMDLYFILVEIMLITALFKQIEYNPYSYNTIYYIGFALFILFVLGIGIFFTIEALQSPGTYRAVELLAWMETTARLYMLLTFPFVLLFSFLLCLSNLSLMRHEGKRLANILGILFGILFSGGVIVLFFLERVVMTSIREMLYYQLFVNLYAAIYLYFECMLVGAIIASLLVIRYQPEADKDYMIILGCGLRKDGTPTPLLRGRIDRALAFYRKQKSETGKEMIFVASGGQGKNEVIAEGLSMKGYLVSQGIPEDRIIVEDQSESTYENMKFSKEKIQERTAITKEIKIAFSTTNYHVFRSGLFARRVKMRAVGIGAKTKWYFWPNAWVREFVGLLTEHRGKQALTIGGMILIYILLTLSINI